MYCVPRAILADVVWPSLALEFKLLSALPIAAGLIAEGLVLRYAFGLSWKRALEIDFGMNVISALAGMFLIPIAGIFGVFLGPGIWAYTFVITVLITTMIEAGVVNWGFKIEVDRKRFAWLSVGNILSVSFAFVLLLRNHRVFS